MTGERNLLHQCGGGEEIIYLVSLQHSLARSPGFLDLSWCSAGLLGVNRALLSHCNQSGYVTVTDYDLRQLETWCVSAKEVRWLSLDITPTQFGWVP